MEVLQFLALLGAVILVIVALVAAYRAAERRRQELAALAAQLGLRFTAADRRGFDEAFRHSVFSTGRSRRAYNIVDGRLEVAGAAFDVTMGDYRYTVQQGKHSTTYRFSFLIMRPPWPGVPDLEIRPEHLGDKIMGAIGFDDIDFESEEFSRKFMVQSRDKRFAYAVVHPRMMEYLLEVPGPKIAVRDRACLFMRQLSTWSIDEFRVNVAWARRFFELWPDHLVAQLREGHR